MKKFALLSLTVVFIFFNCISQPGGFDQSFGSHGKVITNIQDLNKGTETFYAMVLQPDGKIVAAGRTFAPGIICRYNANGTLDNSFGDNGMFFVYNNAILALALQPDGKIVAGGNGFLVRLNLNGSLDNSFDGDGMATGIGGSAFSMAMTLQSDGKILIVGNTIVARFNSNGSPDNSFNGSGQVNISFGGGTAELAGVAVQPNGKIIISGNIGGNVFYAARFNTDGSPDNSFDGDGQVTTDITTSSDRGYKLAIQGDGKILLAGYASGSVALVRYNTDGSLDNGFDGDGIVTRSINSHTNAPGLLIQPDGKIVVATSTFTDFAVLRYNTDGSPDNSFDGDGMATTDMTGTGITDRALCAVQQPDGKIIVGGQTEPPVGSDFAIARYNTDGSLDNSFDGDGKLTGYFGTSYDLSNGMAVQNDGKIIVVGETSTADLGSITDFAVTRYLPNGTLDNSFDGDGRVVTSLGVSKDVANAIAIQPDGKIVVGGQMTASNYDFALTRYNADGSLDNSFDGDGKVITTVGPREDAIWCLAIQPDGKIIAAGYLRLSINTDYDFAIARYNSDGSLDNSFDADGIMTFSVGSGAFEGITAMTLQNDGKIVLVGRTANDMAIIRLNADGSFDNSFDGDGKLILDFNSATDAAQAVQIQSDGKILIAGVSAGGLALVRLNSNGTFDNSFDGDGKLLLPSYPAACMALQTDGKILVGTGDYSSLLRLNSDGSPDLSFDGDGIANVNPNLGTNTHLTAMKLYSNRIYLSGYSRTQGADDFVVEAIIGEVQLASLPLQLRDFSGKRVIDDAILDWKTEHESNMVSYSIERSFDGRSYYSIGEVLADNKAEVNRYNFTDHNISSLNTSVIYYRLKEKNIDSKFDYSRIIALPLDKNRNIVIFYPNPVINEANIALTSTNRDKLVVTITDNHGRLVKHQSWDVTAGSMSLSIDIRSLAAGMYYLEIKGENIDYKKQFIK